MIRDVSGFHRVVWVLFFGNLVNSIGSFMIRPFLSLYLYNRMGVSTTSVGLFMGLMALAGLATAMVSGSLADRFGRRRMMMGALAAEALVLLLFSRAQTFTHFLVLGVLMGSVGPMFWPASSAAVADVTPSEKRAHAYGLLRIAINVGAAVGPLVGAVLVTRSYSTAFLITASSTTLYAVTVALLIPETRPAAGAPAAGEAAQSAAGAAAAEPAGGVADGGYRVVLRDTVFLIFLIVAVLVGASYSQIETSLAIFLSKFRSMSPEAYASLIALNGLLVVLLQIPITHLVNRYHVHLVLAASSLLYALGFVGFGVMPTWEGLVAAMVVVTVAEMINAPSYTKFVADISPAAVRGRYMAASGLPWGISGIIGPVLGGFLMGHVSGPSVWYAAGVMCTVAGVAYLRLGARAADRVARHESRSGALT
ncbi:MAG: MDR family MFS transporter [Bacillota bacterium]